MATSNTGKAAFGEEIRRDHFSFDPGYRPLNHGSFGAFPKSVAERRRQLHLEIEARPDTFLRYTYPKLLLEARAAIAPLTTPVEPHAIEISYPIEDDEIVRLFEEAVRAIRAQGKTVKLTVFDTVLTLPGVRFPWEPLLRLCKDLDVLSFIDGAHGVGHIDLTHLGELRPDFMIINYYKWPMVPRGCALLYVPFANQHIIRTTYPTSWGYEAPEARSNMTPTECLVRLFVKVSTSDTTPYACVPQAISFRRDTCGGEDKVREYCEDIAREGGRRMAEMLGTEVLENESQTLRRCCFTNVRPPLSPARPGLAEAESPKVARRIKERTPEDYDTYIPTSFYAGAFCSRLIGQIYLTSHDFVWAATTLLDLCRRVEAGEWKQV